MIGQGLFLSFRLLAQSLVSAVLVLAACAGPAPPVSVQQPELTASLDNTTGTAPLPVQIEFERNFYYKIIQRLSTDEIPAQQVQDKIVVLYELPPNNLEETLQTALCPITVVIPLNKKAKIIVEWAELWAEGVINEDTQGEGNHLGTYRVFLGYVEPCSLISQENISATSDDNTIVNKHLLTASPSSGFVS